MNGEQDLAGRMAALERRLNQRALGRFRRLARSPGWLAIALVLTLNLWMVWEGQRRAASERIQNHFWVVCQPGATGEERRAALTALVRAGNRQWRSAQLQHLDLRESRFDGAALDWADLEGCDLTDASMVAASLHGANLQLGRLRRADLSSADLSESFLRKADLIEASLRKANLRSASLEQADMKKADFEEADLSEANVLLAVLAGANLKRARLAWANLDAADFSGADVAGANFEGSSIRDAYFADCNWWRAVGLPSAALERFKTEFAPTAETPEGLRKDYQEWLRKANSGE